MFDTFTIKNVVYVKTFDKGQVSCTPVSFAVTRPETALPTLTGYDARGREKTITTTYRPATLAVILTLSLHSGLCVPNINRTFCLTVNMSFETQQYPVWYLYRKRLL